MVVSSQGPFWTTTKDWDRRTTKKIVRTKRGMKNAVIKYQNWHRRSHGKMSERSRVIYQTASAAAKSCPAAEKTQSWSIHQCRPTQRTLGERQEYTLDGSPVHHKTHTPSKSQISPMVIKREARGGGLFSCVWRGTGSCSSLVCLAFAFVNRMNPIYSVCIISLRLLVNCNQISSSSVRKLLV